ncbi:MAG: hypothetical protein ABIK39_05985 [candidate division WOR-3 bacterium]
MILIYFILLSGLNLSYTPVKANIGYSIQRHTIANFSVSNLGLSTDAFSLGVSLFGVENFFKEQKEGKIECPYSWTKESLDLVIRYRFPFSFFTLYGEIYPLKRIPLYLKLEGSLWAKENVDNWYEAIPIDIPRHIWYEYIVYELFPSQYGKVSLGVVPVRLINSDIVAEIGYMNIKYPKIGVKEIKTSYNQFYFSVGTKFLNKKSADAPPWETVIATGIDATTMSIFALGSPYLESYVKDWQLIALGSLGTLSGAIFGYYQNILKNEWAKLGYDENTPELWKKACVGVASGTFYGLTMIVGYSFITRDWPHAGDYMARDLTFLALLSLGSLGHIATSLIF